MFNKFELQENDWDKIEGLLAKLEHNYVPTLTARLLPEIAAYIGW